MVDMSNRDKFMDLQKFVIKVDNNLMISHAERERYYEKVMYYHIGVHIASLNVEKMPFFKMKCGMTYRLRISKLGERILRVMSHASQSRLFGWDEEYASVINYSPLMKLTYTAFAAATSPAGESVDGIGFIEPLVYEESKLKMACGKRTDELVEALNGFLLQLKEALNKDELREEVKNFYRNAKERYLQLMKVALQAWEINCKNILIRIDWGFNSNGKAIPFHFKTEKEIIEDFKFVNLKKNLMLKKLKKMYGNDLSFYAWKMECGYKKGLHIHWLIALNGSKYQSSYFHAKAITDEWKKNVCGDESYVWNVMEFAKGQEKYLRNLDYRDKDLMKILDTYTSYLTKLDVTMKLSAPNGFRTFGCSKMKTKLNKKTGPKRMASISFGNDL